MATKKKTIQKVGKKKKRNSQKYKPFVTKNMMRMFDGNTDLPADHKNAGDGMPPERFFSGGDG